MDFNNALQAIDSGRIDNSLQKLYGENAVLSQRQRYIDATKKFAENFGEQDIFFFSAPGRTEIGGNHTDHNHGRVLAGSVNLDVIAVVSPSDSNIIRVKSEGYDLDDIDLNTLSPQKDEEGTSASLIRGIAARFTQLGYNIGGFDAYTTSSVLKGSGLSSSAAFEVLIAVILSHLYNNGNVSDVECAQISQYAENCYFGKPCGLMDQMASSVGGLVTIDFKNPDEPIIERLQFDLSSVDHSLCIVDAGANHADLTDDYASIPMEMKKVAACLGCDHLRETSELELMNKFAEIRENTGDRAVLRAIHFFRDNERVLQQAEALKNGDFDKFKMLINESGRSSAMYLQNIYSTKDYTQQSMMLALAITEGILGSNGAWRVHGGGFAGTIQAFVPNNILDVYKSSMDAAFGEGNCHILNIRPVGGVKIEI